MLYNVRLKAKQTQCRLLMQIPVIRVIVVRSLLTVRVNTQKTAKVGERQRKRQSINNIITEKYAIVSPVHLV